MIHYATPIKCNTKVSILKYTPRKYISLSKFRYFSRIDANSWLLKIAMNCVGNRIGFQCSQPVPKGVKFHIYLLMKIKESTDNIQRCKKQLWESRIHLSLRNHLSTLARLQWDC